MTLRCLRSPLLRISIGVFRRLSLVSTRKNLFLRHTHRYWRCVHHLWLDFLWWWWSQHWLAQGLIWLVPIMILTHTRISSLTFDVGQGGLLPHWYASTALSFATSDVWWLTARLNLILVYFEGTLILHHSEITTFFLEFLIILKLLFLLPRLP